MFSNYSKVGQFMYLFKILEFLWVPKAHSSVDRQNPMKNFNSIDSRWVVEITVKIWEISGREEIF